MKPALPCDHHAVAVLGTVQLHKMAECGDGVCAALEAAAAADAGVQACTADCPFQVKACPHPGTTAVSNPEEVYR